MRTRKTPNADTFYADFTLTFLRFAETHAKWPALSPNAQKCKPEKLQIRILFTQCMF